MPAGRDVNVDLHQKQLLVHLDNEGDAVRRIVWLAVVMEPDLGQVLTDRNGVAVDLVLGIEDVFGFIRVEYALRIRILTKPLSGFGNGIRPP